MKSPTTTTHPKLERRTVAVVVLVDAEGSDDGDSHNTAEAAIREALERVSDRDQTFFEASRTPGEALTWEPGTLMHTTRDGRSRMVGVHGVTTINRALREGMLRIQPSIPTANGQEGSL